MAKVPLPGLANLNSNKPLLGTSSSNNKMSNVPKGKNPFERIGVWTGDPLSSLQVIPGPIEETTEQARRTQAQRGNNKSSSSSNTRHWRSNVTFECNGYKSRVIKNFRVGVPRVNSSAYGDNYCYASLQKSVADKIIAAYAAQNVRVTHVENSVHGGDEEWYATINNMSDRTGFIKEKQFVEKPLSVIINETKGGVRANIDFIVSMKLKKEGNMGRDDNDVFTLAVECSRFVVTGINEDIPAPSTRSQIPTISLARDDVIEDELADALDKM